MAWLPKLKGRSGPLYQQIVDALRDDVGSARVAQGTRLPAQRELAKLLGVTVGTVAHAYRLAQGEGIVVSGVGSGTYVQSSDAGLSRLTKRATAVDQEAVVDLSQNSIVRSQHRSLITALLNQIAEEEDLIRSISYSPHVGKVENRNLAANWIAEYTVLSPSPNSTIVCNGGQHALDIALRTLVRPGDSVLVEDLTYPGLRAAAAAFDLRLIPIQSDDNGLVPSHLDRTARATGAKVLFTVTTMHTATATTMPEARRREVANIASKRDLFIVEDAVFEPLQSQPTCPIASLAVDRTLYLSSISKVTSSALQCGILVVPTRLQPRAADVIRASCWSASPIAVSLAMSAIADGTASKLLERNKSEAGQRQKLARSLLAGQCHLSSNEHSYHLWITLPSPRAASSFFSSARAANVAVAASEAFWVDPESPPPPAFRLSLMAPESLEDMTKAIEKLRLALQGNYGSIPSLV